MSERKPTHVKPSFYSFCYEGMKEIAKKYGYNLLIHGSMNRDCDLVAVPWSEELGKIDDMISEIADVFGGEVMRQTEESLGCFPHGRLGYVVEMNRGGYWNNFHDHQYYFDISVIPPYVRNRRKMVKPKCDRINFYDLGDVAKKLPRGKY
jgi:hypothetical protein